VCVAVLSNFLRCFCGLADDEVDSGSSSLVAKEKKLPDHLQPDSTLVFSVTVIEAAGISLHYSDVFCQLK